MKHNNNNTKLVIRRDAEPLTSTTNSILSRYSLRLSNTVVAESDGSTPIKIKYPSLDTILNQFHPRHFPSFLPSSTNSLSIFSKNFLKVITIMIAELTTVDIHSVVKEGVEWVSHTSYSLSLIFLYH
jgi:hypothetical protein